MTITLSDADAIQYKDFCQYYEKFTTLKECGALDMRSGKATIHFDQQSVIRKVECDAVVFIRKDVLLVKQ